MRAPRRLLAGLALSVGLFAAGMTGPSGAARAATINLDFPSTDPTVVNRVAGICGPFAFGNHSFGSPCEDHYRFSLAHTTNVTILLQAFGAIGSYEWNLSNTPYGGSGGPFIGPATLADLGPVALSAGVYWFCVTFKTGATAYRLTLADPVSQTPIPGAALLFGSGLAALGFAGRRKYRKSETSVDA